MVQNPSREANSCSASQEIPYLGLKDPLYVHKGLPLDLILSQINPVFTFTSCFKIYLNIVLSSISVSPKWSLPLRFSDWNLVLISHLSHVCYIPCPPHPSWFDNTYNIWWKIQFVKLFIMQFSPVSCYFLSLKLCLH
jgi:hypothetical protein